MKDQFAEWDKFTEALETTVTVEGGYQRYKARRKKRQAAAKKALAARTRKRAEAKQG